MLAILALLTIPIYILCRLVRKEELRDSNLSHDQTASCIGILLVSTLLFSAVVSLFTKAKRHEVLGAAAA